MVQPPWHNRQRKIAARHAKFRRASKLKPDDPKTKAGLRAAYAVASNPHTAIPSASPPRPKCGRVAAKFKW